MQNLKQYKIKNKEKIKISKDLGLNLSKNNIYLKQAYIQYFNRKLNLLKKLKEETFKNINFGVTLKNYRGYRNLQGYPARGQRTHTNAKTKKKFKIKFKN